MTQVQTVCGPLPVERLGETLMHESIGAGAEPQYLETAFAYAKGKLNDLARQGCSTVVDVDFGRTRSLQYYRDMAAQVPLNFVLATGMGLESWMPQEFGSWSTEQMEALFLQEVTEGIFGSNLRAAIVRAAADLPELSPWEVKLLTAAARTQAQTGVPVITHACAGARSQFDCLVRAGADPARTCFAHVEAEFGWEGRSLSEEAKYLAAIAGEGGNFYFNNFGFDWDTPPEDLAYLIHYLCDKGYSKNIFIGLDCNFSVDEQHRIWHEAEQQHPSAGARVYAYVYTHAIPLLRNWGIREQEIQTFLVDNPRRFFGATKI